MLKAPRIPMKIGFQTAEFKTRFERNWTELQRWYREEVLKPEPQEPILRASADEVEQIINLHNSGMMIVTIAEKLGKPRASVANEIGKYHALKDVFGAFKTVEYHTPRRKGQTIIRGSSYCARLK